MTILYVASSKNRLKAIEVENKTGKFVRLIQDINLGMVVQPALASEDGENYSLESVRNVRDNKENSVDDSFGQPGLLGFFNSRTATTEWIERHPTFDSLLYVFTSFWDKTSAIVTTYRIMGVDLHDVNGVGMEWGSTEERRNRGRLKKLGSVQTKGLHVSHVTFSPDHLSFCQNGSSSFKQKKPPSIMCVGHYMDGSLSFFDCSCDAALGEPIRILTLPEVRPETRNTTFPNPLPSIHHVTYNPRPPTTNFDNRNNSGSEGDDKLCKYLLVSDTSKQARVWTFAVDSSGLPISDDPDSFRKVTYITPPSGWLTRILTGGWVVGLADYRIRRCIVHPHGRYAYMLLEFNAMIQVYEINPSTGRISGDCLQEIPAIDPDYFGWKKTTGAAIHASAELYATATELFVSNRGFNFWGGSAESSVRIFSIENDGAQLIPKQSLQCEGPVRHFLPNHHRRLCSEIAVTSNENYFSPSPAAIFAGSKRGRRRETANGQTDSGVHGCTNASVEIFVRTDPEALGGTFERAGIVDVGMDDITCIALLD
jgi:hypothetical protein